MLHDDATEAAIWLHADSDFQNGMYATVELDDGSTATFTRDNGTVTQVSVPAPTDIIENTGISIASMTHEFDNGNSITLGHDANGRFNHIEVIDTSGDGQNQTAIDIMDELDSNSRISSGADVIIDDDSGSVTSYKAVPLDGGEALDEIGATLSGDSLVDAGTTESPITLIGSTTATVDGVAMDAGSVLTEIGKALDAAVEFVAKQVDEATEWFTNNAQQVVAQWFANNLEDIIDGNLSVEDGLVDLAQYIGTTVGVTTVVDDLADALNDAFGIEDGSEIAQGVESILVKFATDVTLGFDDGWTSTEYANAGMTAVAGVVSNRTAAKILGGDDLPWGPTTELSSGVGAAVANIVIEGITSDLFNGYDTSDYLRLGATTGVAFAAGYTGVAAANSAAIAKALGIATGNPVVGIVAGAVVGLVGGELIGSLFGSKTFNTAAGEFEFAQDAIDTLYVVDDDEITVTNAQGSTVIAEGQTTILGNIGQDVLVGNDGLDDLIAGNDGSDYIEGQSGDDELVGNDGSDHISGGDGDDLIIGGEGDDIIFGDAGNDTVLSDGDDAATGSTTVDDFVHLGSGDDIAVTGEGRDMVMGGSGNDGIQTDDGDDIVDGGSGDDIIETGDDDDLVLGNLGNDTIILGDGDDLAFGDVGNDQLYGGSGMDILVGGDGIDLLHGENGDDYLLGEWGDDFIEGGIGDDNLSGGEGADVLLGGMDDDLLQGDLGNDVLSGGFGDDTLIGGAGADIMEGEDGDDVYVVSDDATDIDNVITDTGGNDTLVMSWLLEANIGDLAMTQDGDDLVIDVDGTTVATVVDHFDGQEVETLEIENGKTLDLTGLTVTSGVVTTPSVSASGTGTAQTDIDSRLSSIDSSIATQETFFNNTLTSALSDAAYQEILEDEFQTEIYNAQFVDSFSRSRGKCGGHYTVYYLDRVGTLNGTDEIEQLFELPGSYDPNDYDRVVEDADKVVSSFSLDYSPHAFTTVSATITITDYYENGDRVATTYEVTENGTSNVLAEGQSASSTVTIGQEAYTESDRLATGTFSQIDLGISTLQNGSDKLVGAWWGEVITGGSGGDVLIGNGGDDTLDGGSGNDWIFGGGGDDTVYGRTGDDIIFGSDGEDYLEGNEDEDAILGSAGNDEIYGHSGADWIEGGSGNDTIEGGSENDAVFGGEGMDTIEGNEGNDLIDGGNGDDIIYGNDGNNLNSFTEGGETVVNTYTTNNQRYSSITALDGGGYVIVWESDGQDTDDYGIYGQRYNADGSTAGSEFAINTHHK